MKQDLFGFGAVKGFVAEGFGCEEDFDAMVSGEAIDADDAVEEFMSEYANDRELESASWIGMRADLLDDEEFMAECKREAYSRFHGPEGNSEGWEKDPLTERQRQEVEAWLNSHPEARLRKVRKPFRIQDPLPPRNWQRPSLGVQGLPFTAWEKGRFLRGLYRLLQEAERNPSSKKETRALGRGEVGTFLGLGWRYLDCVDPSLVEEDVVKKGIVHPVFLAQLREKALNR